MKVLTQRHVLYGLRQKEKQAAVEELTLEMHERGRGGMWRMQ